MIRPNKYMDLDTCVISVVTCILEKMLNTPVMEVSELIEKTCHSMGEDARYNIMPAISFLYLAGRIEFDIGRDAISLTLPELEVM